MNIDMKLINTVSIKDIRSVTIVKENNFFLISFSVGNNITSFFNKLVNNYKVRGDKNIIL